MVRHAKGKRKSLLAPPGMIETADSVPFCTPTKLVFLIHKKKNLYILNQKQPTTTTK